MTLAVYTARIDVADPDRLDITRSGADQAARRRRRAPGAFLAPSAGLVYPALAALKAVHRAEEILGITRWAEEARAVLWERYSAAFRQEMLRSCGPTGRSAGAVRTGRRGRRSSRARGSCSCASAWTRRGATARLSRATSASSGRRSEGSYAQYDTDAIPRSLRNHALDLCSMAPRS